MRSVIIGLLVSLASIAILPAHADEIEDGLAAIEQSRFEEAEDFFSKGYENGNAEGAFYIGRMFELGVGRDANPAGALFFYKDAAEKGSAKALNRIGLMHFRGELGVLQDFTAARDNFCKAGDLGDKEAQFNCAEFLKDGKGGARDFEKALTYYEKSAELEHLGALNTLGEIYKAGESVEKSLEKARVYFEKAASFGNPIGLFELAQMFENGRPMAKDLVKAHLYYNLSNARLHPEAASGLQRVSKELDAKALQQAQIEARAWKAVGQGS